MGCHPLAQGLTFVRKLTNDKGKSKAANDQRLIIECGAPRVASARDAFAVHYLVCAADSSDLALLAAHALAFLIGGSSRAYSLAFCRTAAANKSSTSSVALQSIHASVALIP
mmetsp:Transcript_55383/g.91698  ORF Transcript_55383/g.91698 Transcript_55383/m.91698 type:complete len:112 (+) Transcript_55383:231-566(+)